MARDGAAEQASERRQKARDVVVDENVLRRRRKLDQGAVDVEEEGAVAEEIGRRRATHGSAPETRAGRELRDLRPATHGPMRRRPGTGHAGA